MQCPFAIRWYGFDEGEQSTTVAFEAQPPSGTGPVPVVSGATSFTFPAAGGGDVLNHTETYQLDLAGFTTQENQGYHVKVTVTVSGAQGNDTKSKVFWVTPCVTPSVLGRKIVKTLPFTGQGQPLYVAAVGGVLVLLGIALLTGRRPGTHRH